MTLQLKLFGGFEVRCDGVEVQRWPRASAKRLLKLLAVHPQHAVTMKEAASVLWSDEVPDSSSHQRLHHIVYLLRSALRQGAGDQRMDRLLRVQDRMISFSSAVQYNIDVDEFERQLDLALVDGIDVARLEHALTVYRGPLLPEDASEQWVITARRQLEQRYVGGLHALADTYAKVGNAECAINVLQRLLRAAPADERAHRELITLYGRTGRSHEANRQLTECKVALNRDLGTTPSEVTKQAYQLAAKPRRPSTPPEAESSVKAGRALDLQRHRPPAPVVRLIARERIVSDLRNKLLSGAIRLLTLVGLGGVGKTQLAIRIAYEVQHEFPNGVCFVCLAEVGDEGFTDCIAQALGVQQRPGATMRDTVIASLRDRHLLLVLDSLEHLGTSLTLVPLVLEHCPQVTVLTTSRSRLNFVAEYVARIEPLDCSGLNQHGTSTLTPAAALFVERAKAAHPGFEMSAANAVEVAAIVQALGGLPLAIELAAARSSVLSPAALRIAVDQDLRVIANGGRDRHLRHRSLEESFLWSYRLLPEAAQATLRMLSLFQAPFTAKLAGLVCDLPLEELLDSLQALIDSGLVNSRSEPALPTPSLCLHQTTRSFAQRLLDADAQSSTARYRFAQALADEVLQLRAGV